jgi:hypothetical protein
MILCDTAPLFCLVDKSQPRHFAVKTFIQNNQTSLIWKNIKIVQWILLMQL